ncbi:glycosyltransferase family 9 protein [Dyadobacter sp. NIV53]|uniref:glycosyltransferase family 9 protein n=1 Tax=Dyadobacter sp. NIV53 TaxID=2861765 RepID=UPI001C86DC48|nr:glycosyltransferase family 9 protein [Dyadobacter sp. NIV53]
MKLKPETVRKIAVFRALQLGDMLCAVPALRALRAAYPAAHITLLGLPWAASFVSRFSAYIDSFIHFPGYPGLPEQPFNEREWTNFSQRMKQENFDLILQMQGNGSIVNEMLQNISTGVIAGFHSAGNYMPGDLFIQYPAGISEILRHLLMLENLGISQRGTDLEFPITDTEVKNLELLNLPVKIKNYVCVHPGSRGSWRQWPPANFASLADHCAENGYQIIVTGTREEATITRQVVNRMSYSPVDLTGQTGLGEIGQLIKDAALLISNCTGVSHIAAATKTPSVVISMDGEPERWAPLDTTLHKTIDWTKNQDFDMVLEEMQHLVVEAE